MQITTSGHNQMSMFPAWPEERNTRIKHTSQEMVASPSIAFSEVISSSTREEVNPHCGIQGQGLCGNLIEHTSYNFYKHAALMLILHHTTTSIPHDLSLCVPLCKVCLREMRQNDQLHPNQSSTNVLLA